MGLQEEDRGSLPLERIFARMDEWAEMGVFQLALSGGEALTSPMRSVLRMLTSRNMRLFAGAAPSGFIILMDLFDPGGRNQAIEIFRGRRLGYYLVDPSGSDKTFHIVQGLKNIIFEYDLYTHGHHDSLMLTLEEIISFFECEILQYKVAIIGSDD